MRDLNECKAEIFSRSEKRIKERRIKRIRVLALCVPLCLIFAVAVSVLPFILTENEKLTSDGESVYSTGAVGNNVNKFVQVKAELVGATTSQSTIIKVDSADVNKLYDNIQSAFEECDFYDASMDVDAVTDGSIDDVPPGKAPEASTVYNATIASSGYRIVFTAEDGSQEVYYLSGNKLINESTKQVTSLTAEQQYELLNDLGLVIEWKEDSE